MLVRPDSRLLRSLAVLRNHPSWDTVLDHLIRERAKALEMLAESADEVALRRLQGRAQVLKEVLDLADKPDEFLAKLEAPKRLSDF
jgi:hypothetical protein